MKLLQVQGLSYSYEDRPVLRDISFSLEPEGRLFIAGANGSGKSTLLELIAGCLRPTAGSLTLNGRPLLPGKAGPHRQTGMVFQDPENQLFMPTVWEDTAFGIMRPGVSAASGRAQALEALQSVGAAHLAERPPHTLSGGEQQRAAIAAALILQPALLLLDEPTAALDPRSRWNLITLLRTLPCAAIIAGHDLDMMRDLDGAVLFLHQGRIAGQGRAGELLRDQAFLRSIALAPELDPPPPLP